VTAAAPLLLAELRRLDVHVNHRGGYIEVDAPAGVLTESLEARISLHKPELLRLIAPASLTLDQGFGCREVLGFGAALLASLPLATSLVLEPLDGGNHRTVSATSAEWGVMVDRLRPGTHAMVADVLAHHGLRLRAVVIEGGT